jgi:hypothetical protein
MSENLGIIGIGNLIRQLGILVGPSKLMGLAGMDALPYRMSSGDYHKNGKKKIVLVVWGVLYPYGNTIVRK